jgi:hypothetical protein
VVRWPGDEAVRQWLKASGGGEVRRGRGAFYMCRGGAGRPDGVGNRGGWWWGAIMGHPIQWGGETDGVSGE